MDVQADVTPRSYEQIILDHLSLGTALLDAKNFRLLKANSLFLALLNKYVSLSWQYGLAIGHQLPEFLPRPRLIELFQQVAETGKPFQAYDRTFPEVDEGKSFWNWELKPLSEDGQINYLLLTIIPATLSYPISIKGPEVAPILGYNSHIAAAFAHAQLHTAFKNQEARIRAALNQLPEAVIITEAPDGRICFVNAAVTRILDISAEQLLGTSIFHTSLAQSLITLTGQPFPPEHFIVARALKGESTSGFEVRLKKKNGDTIVLFSSVAPFYAPDGTIAGTAGVFQDITERKSLEEQKNDFLSIASHELRTPITIIRGYAELLQAKIQEGFSLDSPRGRRAIDSIAEQSNRLARMLDAMLDLSRIEKDQLFVHLVPHDLVATMTQFVETQRIVTNTNRFTFTLEGLQQGDALTVCFDEDRIVQLLNNLVSNAIKYSPADGEIEIGLRYCRESPASIVIWVKDVGAGIAKREIPHIFERFHRAGNLDRSISGLGIGLYLVSEIAKRHGGRTWAESVEGQGSTFYVQLPLHMIQ
jgi:PAS domain S-box-containing protein